MFHYTRGGIKSISILPGKDIQSSQFLAVDWQGCLQFFSPRDEGPLVQTKVDPDENAPFIKILLTCPDLDISDRPMIKPWSKIKAEKELAKERVKYEETISDIGT